MNNPLNSNGLRKPYLEMPGATGMPNMKDILSSVPKEREHRFESAGEFITRLAHRVTKWRESCLLYTSPSPRDKRQSRMPSSA